MKSVREEASIILGVPIPKDGLDKVVAELDVLGKLDQAKCWRMMIMLVKKLEEIEKK